MGFLKLFRRREADEGLLQRLEYIGQIKNKLPFTQRGWCNELGLFVQLWEAMGMLRLQAGGKYRAQIDAWRDAPGEPWKVKKYNPGDWERLVEPTVKIAEWLLAEGGLREESKEAFMRAVDAEKLAPQVEVSKAEKHFKTGAQLWKDGRLNEAIVEFNEAIAEYSKATIVDPLMLAVAYHDRGKTYLHLGQPQQAIEDFDEALHLIPPRLSPQRAVFYLNRGAAYNALGQAERALQDLDEAIRLDPQDAMAYYNRAASYNALNQFQRALDDFNKAIQLDPHFALAYSSRGVVYDNLGQYQRAIEDYGYAIRLNPELAVAYINRAFVYIHLNKDLEAERDIDRAIALGYDPTVLRREIEEIKKHR